MLRVAGQSPARVVVRDLSSGGAALVSRPIPVGTAVEIDLVDAGGAVTGQVIRSENGSVVITFPNDSATRARLDRALQALAATQQAACRTAVAGGEAERGFAPDPTRGRCPLDSR